MSVLHRWTRLQLNMSIGQDVDEHLCELTEYSNKLGSSDNIQDTDRNGTIGYNGGFSLDVHVT